MLKVHGYLKLDCKVSSDLSTRTLYINVVINKLSVISQICEKLNALNYSGSLHFLTTI